MALPESTCFWEKLNLPNISDDLLPALENKTTSEIVGKNLNAYY